MTGASTEPHDGYSPHLRTALIFTGQGTAGAYQAGVLRALHEAGVKIDLVAGHGIGAAIALFAATDGSQRLWEAGGIWRHRAVARFYGWRPGMRALGLAVAAALLLVVSPLAVLAAGLVIYPVGLLIAMANVPLGREMVEAYVRFAATAFDPGFLPRLLPRTLVFSMAALAVVIAVACLVMFGRRRVRRTDATPWWWRVIRSPLTADRVVRHVVSGLWRLIGGAAGGTVPADHDFCRGYTELLADNLGQPGFREVILVVHDLDARHDLVFAMLAERFRRDFFRRRPAPGSERRAAEAIDLAGVGRDHLLDALRGALVLPVATEPHLLGFAPESYWRGERHRVADRPGAVARLLEETAMAGVEQVIVVSAFPERASSQQLSPMIGDARQRIAEYLAGIDAAAVRDATLSWTDRFKAFYTLRPAVSPIAPLDFRGRFDPQSDRGHSLDELIDRGYEDAYRQFIDPVVAAGGERLGAGRT